VPPAVGGFTETDKMTTKNMEAAAKLQAAREAVCKSAEVLATASLDEERLDALWELVRRMRSEVEKLYAEVAAAIYVKTGVMPHEEPATDDALPPSNLS
jgi:hypothetical protein